MRRSKPEICVDILKVLTLNGPLMPTRIAYKAKANYKVLKQCLGLLVKQNLVEERTAGKEKVVYAITKRGQRAFKCLWVEESSVKFLTAYNFKNSLKRWDFADLVASFTNNV
jgi:predicted transcriptional regulator